MTYSVPPKQRVAVLPSVGGSGEVEDNVRYQIPLDSRPPRALQNAYCITGTRTRKTDHLLQIRSLIFQSALHFSKYWIRHCIGVADGGREAFAPPPSPPIREMFSFGQISCKIRSFCHFFMHIFSGKYCLPLPKVD